MSFSSIDQLCSTECAYDFSQDNKNLFFKAMRENFQFQFQRQSYVKFLCEQHQFFPDNLNDYEDLFKIPPVFVGILKINRFCNVSQEDITMTLTSSGTKGQKTQLLLDKQSLERLEKLADSCFTGLGYKDETPAHYLVFGYERSKAEHIGTSWSDQQNLKYAPQKSLHWTIKWNDQKGEFDYDGEAVARLFLELINDAPVRLIGFPAFIHEMVTLAKKLKSKIKVDPRSFIIAGGGWKNHQGTPLSHQQFAQFMEENTGLPHENVRDAYGMAEHGVPYASCGQGHHHVPIYSRLKVINPLSSQCLDYGQQGLLQLFTPYNTTQPNLSILSTDLVVLEKDCPCGLQGDYIKSIQRGGKKKHKGCAIAAQEILSQHQESNNKS
ncbi:MAG: acyl-protein synthetase LuxE [bacterium]